MPRRRICGRCGSIHADNRCPKCNKARHALYDETQRNQEAKAFYGSKFWRELRWACGERDHFICQDCRQPAGPSFHADHVVPRERGGADELGNLQTLCDRCHGRKTMRETNSSTHNRYLVAGPPCSGKSTWVRDRMTERDLVLCLDRIKHAVTGLPEHETNRAALPIVLAMWQAALREIKRVEFSGAIYIQTTEPSREKRELICGQLGLTEIVMPADRATCLARLERSPERLKDREGIEARIVAWFTA